MACAFHAELEAGLERCDTCGAWLCADCFVVLSDRPYCAGCKLEHVRSLRSGIVPGALDLASIGRRFLGLWIDGLLTTTASYAILFAILIPVGALSATTASGPAAEGISMALLLLMYPILLGLPVAYEGFMLQRRGQTVGKLALGVKVVTPEGRDIGRGQAWGRAALKLVLGSCMGIDYLPALFTRERTCLHDMIARTRVVSLRP
jgi:uncharacterized RDD family membrane protein YckC